jgi:RNA polymerase sigma factor FliA
MPGLHLTYTAKGQLDQNALLKQHQPLVRRLANHLMARVPPSVQVDDLIQVGMMGLMDALARFDASQGIQFETFASQRIRGAMLDDLRANDWMSRRSRKSQKEIGKAIVLLEHKLGRSPIESEIAKEMGMSLADYQSLLDEVKGTQLVHIEDLSRTEEDDSFLDRHAADKGTDPINLLLDHQLKIALVEAIKTLPEREKQVMGMYYEEEMNLKEIAAVLGVTESRVSQIHSQIIARLRTKMRTH